MNKNIKFNPNVISKFLIMLFASATVLKPIRKEFQLLFVLLYAIFFFLNGHTKDAIKVAAIFLLLYFLPLDIVKSNKLNYFVLLFFMILVCIKMFYLPFLAGKFLIKTSDVSSIMAAFNKLKIPREVTIPVAVIFRFFPAYKEERRNIKYAMKLRGITIKNPIEYTESVIVPSIFVSSNISDDIAKAALVRGIESPVKKEFYVDVNFKLCDFIFLALTFLIVIGGYLC